MVDELVEKDPLLIDQPGHHTRAFDLDRLVEEHDHDRCDREGNDDVANPRLNVEPEGSAGRWVRGTEGVTAWRAVTGVGEARLSRFRTFHRVGKEVSQGGRFFRSCITKTRPPTTRV